MIDDLTAGMFEIVGGAFDMIGTATIERSQDLRGTAAIVIDALELAAPADAGATALVLQLPGATAGFAGTVPAGIILTLGGHPYAVAADARVGDGQTLAVTLASGLLSAAAAGDPATIAPAALFSLPGCIRQDVDFRRLPAELYAAAQFALLVPKVSAPGAFLPHLGDLVRPWDGDPALVIAKPFDGAGAWELTCGRQ